MGARVGAGRSRTASKGRKPGERRRSPVTACTARARACATGSASRVWPACETETADGGWRGRLKRLVRGKRPWLRWVLIVAVGWLLLSFISFAISAQIQKGKLPQSAKDALEGGPAVLLGQNILILGGDRRGQDSAATPAAPRTGPAARRHDHGPARLLTSFHEAVDPARQLRLDPGLRRPEDQRLARRATRNSPNGNPASTIKTVENFLGIDINHIVIVNFDGFAEFINTLGGVKIDVPGYQRQAGRARSSAVTWMAASSRAASRSALPPGEVTLQGMTALAYSPSAP